MAPEYAIRGFLSSKSDVFSFGVLLLEIISGRKNYDRQLEAESQELLKLVSRLTILMFDRCSQSYIHACNCV